MIHLPRKHLLLIAGLLATHAALLLGSLRSNFATVDEAAHIPAGLSHWENGLYSAYRVNPPLPRMLAVLPVMLAHPNTDCADLGTVDIPGNRTEWLLGISFARDNGRRYFDMIWLARLAGIGWSLLGGWVIYLWARELYGIAAGCLGLALWCFGPNVLAHAQFVTPDVPCTVAGLAATFVFWHYLRKPSWALAWVAGLLLGIAQLTKFTLLVLYPVWPLLWLIFRLSSHASLSREPKGNAGSALRSEDSASRLNKSNSPRLAPETAKKRVPLRTQAAHLLFIFLLSVVVINVGYEFKGTCQPLGSFLFVSRFLGGEPSAGKPNFDSGESGNRFQGTWLGSLPVPVPADYLRGIDVQKRDFEELGKIRQSYLNGQWREVGWWYYYLYALAIKVPLGTLALVLWALVLTLLRHPSSARRVDELTLWLPALAILVLVSSQTGFSHHLRYVLPIVPFVVISTGKLGYYLHPGRWKTGAAVLVLLGWSVYSSLAVYPHQLSYFNELGGGPENGHAHLLDSNIDWGQDLWTLKDWVDNHSEARPLGIAYFNLLGPEVVGLKYYLPPFGPNSAELPKGTTLDKLGPQPGYYAVSVNLLRGMTFKISDGRGSRYFVPLHAYEYFQHFQPVARAGYSIYLYHITPAEANRVRKQMGLPSLLHGP